MKTILRKIPIIIPTILLLLIGACKTTSNQVSEETAETVIAKAAEEEIATVIENVAGENAETVVAAVSEETAETVIAEAAEEEVATVIENVAEENAETVVAAVAEETAETVIAEASEEEAATIIENVAGENAETVVAAVSEETAETVIAEASEEEVATVIENVAGENAETVVEEAAEEAAETVEIVAEEQAEIVEKAYTSEGIKKRGIKRKDDIIIVKTQTEDIPKATISYETRLQMLRDAKRATKAKEYEDAIKIANNILKERPDDGVALALKENARNLQNLQDAKQATRLKRYEEAIKIANDVHEARPGDEAALALKENARYLKNLRDAKRATKEKRYEDAVEILNGVLEAKPHDKSALFLKEKAKLLVEDRRHNEVMDQLERLDAQERNKYFQNLREKAIPFNDLMKFTTKEKWEDIKKRAQREDTSKGKRLDESREYTERLQVVPSPSQNLLSQEMRDALNNKNISIEFIDTPLSDVVVFLQEKTGVNFVLDKNAAATNVNIKLNDVPVSVILKYILPGGIDHVVKDNVIHITLEPLELRVYDVRDLLINLEDRQAGLMTQTAPTGAGEEAASGGEGKDTYNRVQEIISLITDTVEPASWSINGGRGRIAAREGMLGDIVLTHVARIHKQTSDLLTALRSSADLQIVNEARFIAVSDNFLEELGNNILDFDTTSSRPSETNPKGTPGENPSGGVEEGIFTEGNIFTGAGVAAGTTGLNLSYQILNGFFLEGFLRAVQESDEAETITAPKITLSNTQRGTIKVVTTKSYIES